MKNILFRSILCAIVFIAAANTYSQGFKVYNHNGTYSTFYSQNVDSVVFFGPNIHEEPIVSEDDAVDLGLSVKWASKYVGAENVGDKGNLYAWGEIEPKNSYTKSSYEYYDESTMTYTDIGTSICGTSYDAATVHLGEGWRMPTEQEANDLLKKCTWTWTQYNNINGMLVTGPNGNSIFLPYYEISIYCCLWTGTQSSTSNANCFHFGSTQHSSMCYSNYKYVGYLILPVYDGN